jgi:hypothetical protein
MLWAGKYLDKKLTIEISVNYKYVETDQLPPTLSRRTDKRGCFSTTYGGTAHKYSHSTSKGPLQRVSLRPNQVVGSVLIAVLF